MLLKTIVLRGGSMWVYVFCYRWIFSLVCARMCTYPYYNRFASHGAILDTWVCVGVLLVASVFTPAVI